jgi:hypothetical protein
MISGTKTMFQPIMTSTFWLPPVGFHPSEVALSMKTPQMQLWLSWYMFGSCMPPEMIMKNTCLLAGVAMSSATGIRRDG